MPCSPSSCQWDENHEYLFFLQVYAFPSGGVHIIYRHLDIMNAHRSKTYAVHLKFSLHNKAKWVEPRISEPADWTRPFAQDASLRQDVGAKTAMNVAAYHAEAQGVEFLGELESIERENKFLPSRATAKWTQVSRLRQVQSDVDFAGWDGFKRRIRHELDRHLLWRLQAR